VFNKVLTCLLTLVNHRLLLTSASETCCCGNNEQNVVFYPVFVPKMIKF